MSTPNLLVTLVAVLLIFSSFVFAGIAKSSENAKHMKSIARSKDPTADPCDDFYQYACGSGVEFVDNVGYSEIKYTWDIANMLNKYYPIPKKGKQNYAQKLNIYYQASKKAENAPLLPFLNEIKPGPTQEWPFLEELQADIGLGKNRTNQIRKTNDIDFIGLLAQLFSYGLNGVLMIHKKVDLGQGLNSILLRVPRPTSIAANELMSLLTSFKLPRSIVEKYLSEFIETHQQWQSIYSNHSSPDDYIIRTYAQLKADSGIVSHVAKFVKELFPHPVHIEDYSIAFHLPYIKFLLTAQWQPDEARKLCNYLMFQFLLPLRETVRPGYYLDASATKLQLGLNYVYYKHIYLQHKKEQEEGFASTVKTVYKQLIETVSENRLNLTDQQLQEITTKLDNLRINIGNLPENITDSMVEEYYSALPDLDVNNFYKTELLVRKYEHLETLMCPPGIFCKQSSPHAFYYLQGNIIYFPFNAFAPPMYHWSWHPIFAMSILGNAAGHEFVHAIDTMSLNLDKYTPSFGGNSLQVPTIKAAVSCLSEQYPTDNINERLADVTGSQLAFRTYSREFGMQPQFTSTPWQQLFFLSLAQLYCGKGNDQDTEHDDEKIRVQQIVKNSKDFAEAFQCPVGSKMNPTKKCNYI